MSSGTASGLSAYTLFRTQAQRLTAGSQQITRGLEPRQELTGREMAPIVPVDIVSEAEVPDVGPALMVLVFCIKPRRSPRFQAWPIELGHWSVQGAGPVPAYSRSDEMRVNATDPRAVIEQWALSRLRWHPASRPSFFSSVPQPA